VALPHGSSQARREARAPDGFDHRKERWSPQPLSAPGGNRTLSYQSAISGAGSTGGASPLSRQT